ncbi:hypothetical protein HDU76_000035 [Blyttiomyces sp. JEL0837]|nr:hypothetical protein HDU76_000035 [Blyttiomyces sp. JEL0837]
MTNTIKHKALDTQEDDDSYVEEPIVKKQKVENPNDGTFLETINRYMLDFDFEKLCSVSLSNLNVYACLVCGKYYQGRGEASHAYFHSLHEDHHVFINLETLKVFILPDGYEVKDTSLNDIKFVLSPVFTKDEIARLDQSTSYSYDLSNKRYLPGFVGLNNIKANDYVNVIIQALAHIKPLRDVFLTADVKLTTELGNCGIHALSKDKCHLMNFFRQEIANASAKKFRLSEQSDAIDFLAWFLNSLHTGLGGGKKAGSSIIHRIFQGELRIESQKLEAKQTDDDDEDAVRYFEVGKEMTSSVSKFMFLTLDLPPPPLFQDELERSIIPQVPLSVLLSKYDGISAKDYGTELKRMKITKLPEFLVFNIKRFTKNRFVKEKNPTIVNFPIKNLDMRDYVDNLPADSPSRYDLVANICHEGKPGAGNGSYRCHVHSKGRDQWFHIQDLIVEEIAPQMIFLSESYIQIWERVSA